MHSFFYFLLLKYTPILNNGKTTKSQVNSMWKITWLLKLVEFHKHKSSFNEGVSAVALRHATAVRTTEHTRVTVLTLHSWLPVHYSYFPWSLFHSLLSVNISKPNFTKQPISDILPPTSQKYYHIRMAYWVTFFETSFLSRNISESLWYTVPATCCCYTN